MTSFVSHCYESRGKAERRGREDPRVYRWLQGLSVCRGERLTERAMAVFDLLVLLLVQTVQEGVHIPAEANIYIVTLHQKEGCIQSVGLVTSVVKRGALESMVGW